MFRSGLEPRSEANGEGRLRPGKKVGGVLISRPSGSGPRPHAPQDPQHLTASMSTTSMRRAAAAHLIRIA